MNLLLSSHGTNFDWVGKEEYSHQNIIIYCLNVTCIFFSFLYHAENYQNKTLFAYFTNYWVWWLDDMVVMIIGLVQTFAGWTLKIMNIILEAIRDRCLIFVTPYWWSHKHNNNSNILNNYTELKFIGVFLFSLRFPAVFCTHIFSYLYDLIYNVS